MDRSAELGLQRQVLQAHRSDARDARDECMGTWTMGQMEQTHMLLPDGVIGQVDLAQLGERLQSLNLGPLVDLVVGAIQDLQVDQLLDACEGANLVVRDPQLLESVRNLVQTLNLLERIATQGQDLQRVATRETLDF